MEARNELIRRIEMPKDVVATIENKRVNIKGPKGELSRDFDNPKYNQLISIEKSDAIEIKYKNRKTFKTIAGTIEAHIRNMMLGVTVGFEYKMKIVYSHFPISIAIKGNEIHVRNFLGEKGARIAKFQKCSVKADKDEIMLSGIDIEALGQTAQRIEQACRLSGRDRRIFHDGIFLSGRYLATGEKI